jgi:hypothetical protein
METERETLMELPEDAQVAHLYRNDEAQLFGIVLTRNPTALQTAAPGSWEWLRSFPLGVQEVLPVNLDPEPALRGIEAQGFFVWPEHQMLPFGTSQ